GFPAGFPGRDHHQSHARQQIGGGTERRRRDRARQGDPGGTRLGVFRQRHGATPRARNVQAPRRHQAQPHPLSRRRSGAQRSHRRAGGGFFFHTPPSLSPVPPP